MGYFVPASADDRLAGPYADYDTALTALRADSSASDGDVYQLTSGDVYVAQSIGSSYALIPSAWVDQIQEDMSNASGSALRIAGEAAATTLARGWYTGSANGATIAASGDALRLDTGDTSSAYAQLRFTPTSGLSGATGFLLAVTLQVVDIGTTAGRALILVYDGTVQRNLFLDFGASAGALRWTNGSFTGIGASDVAIGTDKKTLWIYLPASGEYGSVQVEGAPRQRCIAPYSGFGALAASDLIFSVSNSGGGASNRVALDLFDVACWEVTP